MHSFPHGHGRQLLPAALTREAWQTRLPGGYSRSPDTGLLPSCSAPRYLPWAASRCRPHPGSPDQGARHGNHHTAHAHHNLHRAHRQAPRPSLGTACRPHRPSRTHRRLSPPGNSRPPPTRRAPPRRSPRPPPTNGPPPDPEVPSTNSRSPRPPPTNGPPPDPEVPSMNSRSPRPPPTNGPPPDPEVPSTNSRSPRPPPTNGPPPDPVVPSTNSRSPRPRADCSSQWAASPDLPGRGGPLRMRHAIALWPRADGRRRLSTALAGSLPSLGVALGA